MVFNRFERFTSFKPPAMPVVYDLPNHQMKSVSIRKKYDFSVFPAMYNATWPILRDRVYAICRT